MNKNLSIQYALLFWFSWIALYMVFPVWISKHNILSNLPQLIGRPIIITALGVYSLFFLYAAQYCFNKLSPSRPVIVRVTDWVQHIKKNIGLVSICLLSILLHLREFSLMPVVGEESFLRQSFWMYDALVNFWHKLFSFPLQYFFWLIIALIAIAILINKKNAWLNRYIDSIVTLFNSSILSKALFFCLFLIVFNLYSFLYPYFTYIESLEVIRYPPLSRYLYLLLFSGFDISLTAPRILQLTLYILGAVYMYRTVLLFSGKEPALLTAAIYLFSPILFTRASSAAAESGAVLFIILISFYFLRFLKTEDSRDLILATYFIGLGFMYKRGILLMFPICFVSLLLIRLKKLVFKPLIHYAVLLLSLFTILPYMKIGTGNPLILSNLVNFDELIRYLLMLNSQLSIPVMLLLCASFFYVIVKRDTVSLYFGIQFLSFYLLFTIMHYGQFNHRYAMSLYPAIAVFIAQFVYAAAQNFRWKHTFKLIASVLIVYLAILCVIPRSNTNLITYEYRDFEIQYYPWKQATDWIITHTGHDDKVLGIYLTPDFRLYVSRLYADSEKVNEDRILHLGQGREDIFTPYPILKQYCKDHDISYVMLRYGPNNSFTYSPDFILRVNNMKYLKEHLNGDADFTESARFNTDDNFIIIYKRSS